MTGLNLHRGGSGETLVLLHGLGSRWQMWTPVVDELEQRFDVIAPDLPGFGDSPMPAPGTPAGAQSLCSLLLSALADLGVEPGSFHVAGDSLGGLMSLELARRGAVRSACAFSPAGFANRAETLLAQGSLIVAVRGARWMAPRADRLLARPRARRLLLSTFFARPERIPAAMAAGDMRAMASAPWFDATLPTIERWHFPDGDGITAPVTIAWGDKDRLLLPRQAARAREEIPRARIVMLPGCGHVPTWDDPPLVARVIAETTAAAGAAG
jgi:pimeloyl-ACP methyl ester carboxylesterase